MNLLQLAQELTRLAIDAPEAEVTVAGWSEFGFELRYDSAVLDAGHPENPAGSPAGVLTGRAALDLRPAPERGALIGRVRDALGSRDWRMAAIDGVITDELAGELVDRVLGLPRES